MKINNCRRFIWAISQKIAVSANRDVKETTTMLRDLCHKGLVFDLWNGRDYLYAVNPMVVGIFEFTMMRTDQGVDYEKAKEIIEMNSEFALGICSCRHKQEHLGKRECSVPGDGADNYSR